MGGAIVRKLWKILDTRELWKTPFSRMRVDRCELPDGRIMPAYYTMELRDWVNVVALTPQRDFILVDQYRHAAQTYCLEIPGGALDAKDEDLQAAALRELREETGYKAGSVTLVGQHYPNPALQSNRIHTYVAHDCVFEGPQELDAFEDIKVKIVPWTEFKTTLAQGEINHSLMMASVSMVLLYLERTKGWML
jgi:ADP-ribose pyrophosphatase